MKYVKGSLLLLAVTTVLSMAGVNASTYRSFTGVSIPAFSGIYTSESASKAAWGKQSAYKVGAIDKLSGDERAMQARTNGGGNISGYVTLPKGSETTITGNNTVPGSYSLQLRASTSLISGASFSGHWYLDK